MADLSGPPPTKFGIVLFPGFQALDAFGPLDILNMLSKHHTRLELCVLAQELDPVSTSLVRSLAESSFGQSVEPTHTFDSCPDIDVLIVPGGDGVRQPEVIEPVINFLKKRLPKLKYLFTVCTGSAVAARAGALDGRRATTNKKSWAWATAQGPRVSWVPNARWVDDGNVWTCSGISAGIDGMYAFIEKFYGTPIAEQIAIDAEYIRNRDPNYDPFCHSHGLTHGS